MPLSSHAAAIHITGNRATFTPICCMRSICGVTALSSDGATILLADDDTDKFTAFGMYEYVCTCSKSEVVDINTTAVIRTTDNRLRD